MLPDHLTHPRPELGPRTIGLLPTTGAGAWAQVSVEFHDWPDAEQIAAEHLHPALTTAHADGLIDDWWFIRKSPCWRLRYQPTAGSPGLLPVLNDLHAQGSIRGWTAGFYEPEIHAFGGDAGMDVAHDLFSADSRNLLAYLATPEQVRRLGRRELAILWCGVLFRSAGQDWYEHGDIWATVAGHRPPIRPGATIADLDPERRERLVVSTRRLMTVDAGPRSRLLDGGPLAGLAGWGAAFERAGQHLAALARHGSLQRGLRAVLAHHVIFHLNRLGLSAAEQHLVSALAKEAVMGSPDTTPSRPVSHPPTGDGCGSIAAVTTTEITDASRLRTALVDTLRAAGTVSSAGVEAAVRAVPRHLFIPSVPLAEAYADTPVYTKHDGHGASISAASQPTIVATMLERLDVHPGQRILELGAGTGYNAALLAHLAGPDGHVTAVDVDADIVDGARAGLAAAGVDNVEVILGDGAVGFPDRAPYDRIIATVGAFGVPTAWLEQLAPDGRLVVPTRLRGAASRSITFERDDMTGNWCSVGSDMATFMPLRGIADDARRTVAITADASVTLQTHQDQIVDGAALTGVLDQPLHEVWTGVRFLGAESAEWLWLWLSVALPNSLSRMSVPRQVAESGLVSPQFGWGSMATFTPDTLAYLTSAQNAQAADGSNLYEVGVISHGPHRDTLALQVTDAIQTWDQTYRGRAARFEIHPSTSTGLDLQPGRFAVDTPHNWIVIDWR